MPWPTLVFKRVKKKEKIEEEKEHVCLRSTPRASANIKEI